MNVNTVVSSATAAFPQSMTRRTPPALTNTAQLLNISTDQPTSAL
jgi:hypothetical protein